MNSYSLKLLLQVIGAILAITLGILFFVFLPHDPGDVATDAFFVGAGALLLNSTYKASKRHVKLPKVKPNTKKNLPQQRKRRREK